jgi:hypothetical protein
VLSIRFKAIQVIPRERKRNHSTQGLCGAAPRCTISTRCRLVIQMCAGRPAVQALCCVPCLRSPTSSQKVTLITMATLQPFCPAVSISFAAAAARAMRCARLNLRESGSVGISTQKPPRSLVPNSFTDLLAICIYLAPACH